MLETHAMLKLNERQIDHCRSIFNDLLLNEERDKIDYLELKTGLEKLGIEFEHMNVFHKLLAEMENNYYENITFIAFLKIYQKQKENRVEKNEEDTIDAFVAMGGNRDKTGQVHADKLISIIKEF